MIIYSIPLIILSFLTYLENKKNKINLLQKNIFFIFICFLLTIFIGLRTEIGCDWNQYVISFDELASKSWWTLLKNDHKSFNDIGYNIISKALSYNFNFKTLVFIFSIFFSAPLFILCNQLKRRYLALSIAYPYFIIVVGMGPIRQSAAIGFVILAIIAFIKNKYKTYFLYILIGSLLHFSAIIFGSLGIFFLNSFSRKNTDNIFKIAFFGIIIFLIFYNFEPFYEKIFYYIKIYNENGFGINKANSAFLIWLINVFPVSIYLGNISKFKFQNNLKRLVFAFFILEILLLLLIFINNVIAYRFLLYCFPISIYITSCIPDTKILHIQSKYFNYSIMILSISSLFLWFKFANHSSCWVPYQSIIPLIN